MSFEVHLLIRQSGFRPKQIILVTTLLDPKRYPKAKLAQLYHLRSSATEVNFLAPQNHVKHGDDLGKITADGAKGNLDASTGLQFAAKLDVDIGARWRRCLQCGLKCKALGNC